MSSVVTATSPIEHDWTGWWNSARATSVRRIHLAAKSTTSAIQTTTATVMMVSLITVEVPHAS